ncbi:hypothetical protein C8R45DRAFT_932508 [Mycena sanguinolenta]|nr:hypothetical protein C8R45DRAFT_932508 [Mycena sanguinolenta]
MADLIFSLSSANRSMRAADGRFISGSTDGILLSSLLNRAVAGNVASIALQEFTRFPRNGRPERHSESRNYRDYSATLLRETILSFRKRMQRTVQDECVSLRVAGPTSDTVAARIRICSSRITSTLTMSVCSIVIKATAMDRVILRLLWNRTYRGESACTIVHPVPTRHKDEIDRPPIPAAHPPFKIRGLLLPSTIAAFPHSGAVVDLGLRLPRLPRLPRASMALASKHHAAGVTKVDLTSCNAPVFLISR